MGTWSELFSRMCCVLHSGWKYISQNCTISWPTERALSENLSKSTLNKSLPLSIECQWELLSRYGVGWILELVYFCVVLNWACLRLGLKGRRRSTRKKVFWKRNVVPMASLMGKWMGGKAIPALPRLREAYLSGRIVFVLSQDSVLPSCIFAP